MIEVSRITVLKHKGFVFKNETDAYAYVSFKVLPLDTLVSSFPVEFGKTTIIKQTDLIVFTNNTKKVLAEIDVPTCSYRIEFQDINVKLEDKSVPHLMARIYSRLYYLYAYKVLKINGIKV